MELKKIDHSELINGMNYLIQKENTRWMVSQYYKNKYGVDMWYNVDGYAFPPANKQIYELPAIA